MAWTGSKTWAVGELVTVALMGTYVKANQEVIDTHVHGGSAGDGDDEMAGVDSLTHDDISAPSAPASGKTIIYTASGRPAWITNGGSATPLADHSHASRHDDGGADAMASDSTAGTPMLRSLGTTSTTAAAGNHTHA